MGVLSPRIVRLAGLDSAGRPGLAGVMTSVQVGIQSPAIDAHVPVVRPCRQRRDRAIAAIRPVVGFHRADEVGLSANSKWYSTAPVTAAHAKVGRVEVVVVPSLGLVMLVSANWKGVLQPPSVAERVRTPAPASSARRSRAPPPPGWCNSSRDGHVDFDVRERVALPPPAHGTARRFWRSSRLRVGVVSRVPARSFGLLSTG